MLEIKRPECGVSTNMSLCQQVYKGSYRCWKCRQLFNIRIESEEVRFCVPLSQEEFKKWQDTQNTS